MLRTGWTNWASHCAWKAAWPSPAPTMSGLPCMSSAIRTASGYCSRTSLLIQAIRLKPSGMSLLPASFARM